VETGKDKSRLPMPDRAFCTNITTFYSLDCMHTVLFFFIYVDSKLFVPVFFFLFIFYFLALTAPQRMAMPGLHAQK